MRHVNNMGKAQPKLAIALLAAGEASRFGSPKQLARYREQTLIERSIALLRSMDCELFVITGAHHDVIYEHLRATSTDHYVVFNKDWQHGLSSSIKTAVNSCCEHIAGIMFVTVDQIHITPADIQALIDHWHSDRSRIVCAEYTKHRGVPAIFPRSYFEKLRDIQGDKGARHLIQSSPNVKAVALPNAEIDIDTVKQLHDQQSIC